MLMNADQNRSTFNFDSLTAFDVEWVSEWIVLFCGFYLKAGDVKYEQHHGPIYGHYMVRKDMEFKSHFAKICACISKVSEDPLL